MQPDFGIFPEKNEFLQIGGEQRAAVRSGPAKLFYDKNRESYMREHIFGYIRVSSADQNADRQLAAIRERAVPEGNISFEEAAFYRRLKEHRMRRGQTIFAAYSRKRRNFHKKQKTHPRLSPGADARVRHHRGGQRRQRFAGDRRLSGRGGLSRNASPSPAPRQKGSSPRLLPAFVTPVPPCSPPAPPPSAPAHGTDSSPCR